MNTPTLPQLSLSVHYAVPFDVASEAHIHDWVTTSLRVLSQDYELSYTEIILAVRFCDSEESQRLNREYRKQNKPTNVLTFAYGVEPSTQCLSADILVCVPVVHDEAQAHNKPLLHHTAHLCVHGVLHALGFDHITEDDAIEMEALEAKILDHFQIPNPYIIT